MGTATAVTTTRQRRQFQGVFSDMWLVSATVDPGNVAAGAEDTTTITTGADFGVGDCVVAQAPGVNIQSEIFWRIHINTTGALTLLITNVDAAQARNLAASTWKFLVARPNW